MNFFSRARIALIACMMMWGMTMLAQTEVKQLIVASGGAFSNPDDFVTLGTYHPDSQFYEQFGTVRTQAVQDVLIHDNRLYVTATDSIVVYDADTYQRIAATAVSGVRYMLISGDLLYVTIQYPETDNFVKVLHKNTLEIIDAIEQISGEAAGMVEFDGKIYIAVPGDWMSTTGKVAILQAENGTFLEEIDFSEQGVGIHDMFVYENKILAVNRSPWGATTGIVSVFDPLTKQVTHHSFPHVLGKGIAIHETKLYVLIDHAIGSVDLAAWAIDNVSIVPDPGSSAWVYFADVVFDPLNARFYATVTDYFSMGEGHIYHLDGTVAGTFTAGISAEALALDYRLVSELPDRMTDKVNIFPNPALDVFHYVLPAGSEGAQLSLINSQGQIVKAWFHHDHSNNLVHLSGLASGMYVLNIVNANSAALRVPLIVR